MWYSRIIIAILNFKNLLILKENWIWRHLLIMSVFGQAIFVTLIKVEIQIQTRSYILIL